MTEVSVFTCQLNGGVIAANGLKRWGVSQKKVSSAIARHFLSLCRCSHLKTYWRW